MFALRLKSRSFFIKMSRFEEIDDEWYWRGTNELIRLYGNVPIKLAYDPHLRMFLSEEFELLARYEFSVDRAYESLDNLIIAFEGKFEVTAYVNVYMPSGEKRIDFRLPMNNMTIDFNKFESLYKEYYSTRDENIAMRAELAAARERIAALEAENTELRYRPGGLGYDEAAEHFSALIPQ